MEMQEQPPPLYAEASANEEMDLGLIFQVSEDLEETVEQLYGEVNWFWKPEGYDYKVLKEGRMEEMRRLHRY